MRNEHNKTRLEVRNVSHSFGAVQVLQRLSFSVQPGEFVALAGPSGCGKTTLLNILSGYIQPQSGTVHQQGIIRTVHQQDGLFPWLTVAENISMGLRSSNGYRQSKNDLQDLLALVHLKNAGNLYPHELSGGMRQRVELARVLAADSDILLMDEPFSSLDYLTRQIMRKELIGILQKRPRTVVFVTHDIEEAAQLADRILVLSDHPATISLELNIHSEKPRNPGEPEMVEVMKAVLCEMGLQEPSTFSAYAK